MTDFARLPILVVLLLPALVQAAAPQVSTLPATQVTATSAKLEATIHPDGEATAAWFRYAPTPPGSCDDSFGAKVPASGSSVGAGTTEVAFSHVLGGLTPGFTYYYCALASNGSGLTLGVLQSFTTIAMPAATTGAVSNLTSGSAVLNGTGNPRGVAATGWFRYAPFHPGACNDGFGTRAPAAGGTDLGSGASAVPFSEQVTGLTAGATYYLCAIVQNAEGTGYGAVTSFFVPDVPTVTTLALATAPGATTVLRGSANPRGAGTTAWFRWDTVDPGACSDTFGTRAPATGGQFVGSGQVTTTFSEAITGVLPDTTYYYCAIASSSVGTSHGAVLTFTTPELPDVVTELPSPVSVTTTLRGQVDPKGQPGQGWFRLSPTPGACSDTFGTRLPSSGGTAIGATTALVPFSVNAQGLVPGTTYFFCAAAMTSIGAAFGQVLTFTTPTAPTVTTGTPTAVTQGSAQLHAAGTTGGSAATGWFRYGTSNPGSCNDTFGVRVPASGGTALGSANDPVTWTETVATPAAGATYYHCAIASNAEGLTYGTVKTFTSSAAPSVATTPATQLGTSTAVLNGTSNPRNEPATGWFRYATTNPGACNDTFGTRLPASGGTALGAGNATVPFSETAINLIWGTTYYFCALAQNATGSSAGVVQSFILPLPPGIVTVVVASEIGSTSATLRGSGVAGYAPTTVWFRYATTDPGTCVDTFGTREPSTGGIFIGSSGTSAVNFSRNVSGLTPNTTYHVCAFGENVAGKSEGNLKSFTTHGPPTVTTGTATSLTATQATLRGSALPNGNSSIGWFRYVPGPLTTCSDTVGTRAPATGGVALGSTSSTPVAFNQAVSGLQPGMSYSYCAIASNSLGLAFGGVSTFATQPVPPVVTTTGVGAAVGSTIVLHGTANPGGVAGTAWARISTINTATCSGSFGFRLPASGGVALPAGSAAVPFQITSSNLTPGGTYYHCAAASNSAGTTYGAVLSFKAPSMPTVTSAPPTAVTGASVTLQAAAVPNGAAATGWFRFSATSPGAVCRDDFGSRVPVSGGTALGAGATAVPFSQTIGGLVAGATYYACAFASNGVGLSFGQVQTFAAASVPAVLAASASELTSHAVVLSGSALPGGAQATGWFRLQPGERPTCTDTFGTRIPETGGISLGQGDEPASWALPVEGLYPGVTYSFCALASNVVGIAVGEVVTFTAVIDPPVVTTRGATAVNARSATLQGTATPNEHPTEAWFRIGREVPEKCDDTFGSRAPSSGKASLGSGQTPVDFEVPLTGLLPNTPYAFCAVATNAGGAAFGEVATFKTSLAAPEVSTLEPDVDDEGRFKLRGTARPHGSAGSAWFEVHSQDPGTCIPGTRDRLPVGGIAVPASHDAVALAEPFDAEASGSYYYCAVVQTDVTATAGQVRSFEFRKPGGFAGGCGIVAAGSGAGGWLLLGAIAWITLRARRRGRGSG